MTQDSPVARLARPGWPRAADRDGGGPWWINAPEAVLRAALQDKGVGAGSTAETAGITAYVLCHIWWNSAAMHVRHTIALLHKRLLTALLRGSEVLQATGC